MDVLNYKCKSCGAVLHFSPKAQKWICNYCGSEHTIQELNELYGKENLSNYNENYVSYQCQNCGAEIVTDKNTSATFCLYCNSHSIIQNRISGEFKPDKIIPFKISKEAAIKRIKKYNYLLGFNKNILSDEIILQNIKPLYIPCYLFSMDTCVDVSYLEKKLGQFGVAEDYKIQKRLEARFENIPVDGLTQFESKLLNPIEPFDYSEMVEFSPKYLAGYFADRYDSVNEFVENEATKRVMTTLDINWKKIIFPQDILGKFNNIKCEKTCFNKTYQYVLLPIWVLNVEFEGKKYPIIVNGQTGKIAGEIKNDYRKLIKVFFIVLAISILIMMSEFRGTHLKFSTYLSVCLQPSVLITAIIYIVSRNRQKKIKRKESAGEYVDSSSIKVQTIKEEKIL